MYAFSFLLLPLTRSHPLPWPRKRKKNILAPLLEPNEVSPCYAWKKNSSLPPHRHHVRNRQVLLLTILRQLSRKPSVPARVNGICPRVGWSPGRTSAKPPGGRCWRRPGLPSTSPRSSRWRRQVNKREKKRTFCSVFFCPPRAYPHHKRHLTDGSLTHIFRFLLLVNQDFGWMDGRKGGRNWLGDVMVMATHIAASFSSSSFLGRLACRYTVCTTTP